MFVNIVNTQDGESGAGEVSGQSYDVETLGLEYEDIPERKDKIKQGCIFCLGILIPSTIFP